MKTKRRTNLSFQILKNQKIVQRYDSSSRRRFKNHIASINFQNPSFTAYLKANYGNGFYNDGLYRKQSDFLFALDAFADSSISKYLYD